VTIDPVGAPRRTFRLVLEYDGRDFEGWQIQAGERAARTVQGVLAEGLGVVLGAPAAVRGAGRTDAGVHAMGQVASVRVETGRSPAEIVRSLNGWLPRDLVVRQLDEVSSDWDALREARGKHYRYQIWNGTDRSPLRAGRFHWLRDPLAVEPMQEASQILIGTHDFAAFQGAGSCVKTTLRTIEAIEVEGASGSEILLDVFGEGFLRHMVRNLAGTLIEIGRGRWSVERATEILASQDRGEAGPTAPALGLVLVSVRDSWSQRVPMTEYGAEDGGSGAFSVDESSLVG
jgi:tRNA pseudouridine38-40 synthase